MVKIPADRERLADEEAIALRTQFFHDLGLLVSMWNQVELYIEFAIYRRTGMSALHSSVVLGGLQHKAKVSILKSLLKLEGQDEAVSKINSALSYAKRNALMHGVPGSESDSSSFGFFHRRVDDSYKVQAHKFTADEFHEHVWEFGRLANEALLAIGLDENDQKLKAEIDEYGKAAKFEI